MYVLTSGTQLIRFTHVSLVFHSGALMVDFAESYVLLNIEQARSHVSSTLGKKVSRVTFYRWRQFLNLSPPYSLEAVQALSIYGKALAASRSAKKSKQKTLEILREQGL